MMLSGKLRGQFLAIRTQHRFPPVFAPSPTPLPPLSPASPNPRHCRLRPAPCAMAIPLPGSSEPDRQRPCAPPTPHPPRSPRAPREPRNLRPRAFGGKTRPKGTGAQRQWPEANGLPGGQERSVKADGMNRSESMRSGDGRNEVKSTGDRLPKGSPKGGARRRQEAISQQFKDGVPARRSRASSC